MVPILELLRSEVDTDMTESERQEGSATPSGGDGRVETGDPRSDTNEAFVPPMTGTSAEFLLDYSLEDEEEGS